jgi:hypothetical protein
LPGGNLKDLTKHFGTSAWRIHISA